MTPSSFNATDVDYVLTGAEIRTDPRSDATFEALAVGGGRVLAAATDAELSRLAPDARRLRLDGGAVFPGFCDTHMHLEKIAGELAMVHLDAAHTVPEVLALVAAHVSALVPGHWCSAFGDDNAWHEHQLAEGRFPNRTELDAVAPETPVFLYRGPDAAVLNSRAAEELAAELASDPGWDEAKGVFRSPRARDLQTRIPPPGAPRALLARAVGTLLGFGITTVVDPGLPGAFASTWDLYTSARDAGELPLRVWLMDRLDHRLAFDDELSRVVSRALSPVEVAGSVRGLGLKLILDGEFDNAWMRAGEPQPAPAAKRYSPTEIRTVLRLCSEHGWPVCFHVMGGGVIDTLLDAVAAEQRLGHLANSQVTLAHVFLPSTKNLRLMAEFGIALSVQPMLAYVFEQEMRAAWGDLANSANPYRSMLDAGVVVAAGSDVLPCEPLRGAMYAITRSARQGTVLGRDEALAPGQALAMFTSGAEGYLRAPKLGTLAPGAPADFVWWPEDPYAVPAERWPRLRPGLVAIAGNTVLGAEELSSNTQPRRALA